MAGKSAILSVKILTDASKVSKGTTEAEGKFAKFERGANKAGKVAAAGLAVVGAAAFTMAKKAEGAATANARLDAVFASMGDTTGQASRDAQAYAEKLSGVIAVDHKVIKASQAVLATFGEVSNETARSEGIFNRATDAAADLAAAGFGTMESNAVQLGKALNDPVKGLSALARSGVTFTDAEKDKIKALQESGDLLGAQKIVLAAVEKQVKGTAAATANDSDKMALAWERLQEQLGTLLLPIMGQLSSVVQSLTSFIADNATTVGWITGIFVAFAAAIVAVNVALRAYHAVQGLIKAATKAWAAVQWVLNAAMTANPIGLIIAAVAALVAIIVVIATKTDWFQRLWAAAWSLIEKPVKAVFAWIQRNWPLLLAIITGPIGLAVLAVTKNLDAIKAVFSTVFEAIKGIVAGVFDWIMDKFDAIGRAFERVKGWLSKIPGVNLSASTTSAALYSASPTVATSSTRATGGGGRGGGGVVINVSGALDPNAVARQLRAILSGYDVGHGLAPSW